MQCTEGQGFAANYNPSYSLAALRGHTGIDITCGFGTPITSNYDGYVYKVLTVEHPSNDGSGFTGVFLIVDDGIECFEWLVGHCNPSVSEGTRVKKGDLIGTEANHGEVYAGNTEITLAMQSAGDQRGAHRHYQKRPIQKSKTVSTPALSATDDLPGLYRDPQGNYYPVWNYNNGFHGCVDPSKPVFTRDLWIGSQGYDVYVLQRILVAKGLLAADPTGYYGTLTLAAVSKYQSLHGLTPMAGYFGPKTRAVALTDILTAPLATIV